MCHRFPRLMLAAASLLPLTASVPACAPGVEPATMVLRNGVIATVDDTKPEAQALAISGDRIVFVELDGGDPYLYTMAPDGSEYTLLTAQRGWSPSWSPDGSQIAFTDAVTDRLFLIDVNASGGAVGGSLRVLALAGDDKYPVQPVWAPAGGQLAYVYQDTLYIYNLTTNQSIPMAYNLDNPFIAWQP